MSSLQSPLLFQSVPFGDKDSWLSFLRDHDQWHMELAKQTQTAFLPMDDLRDNLAPHARSHDALAAAYGVSPVGDLESFDLNDENSYQSWTYLHSLDHQRFQQASGL